MLEQRSSNNAVSNSSQHRFGAKTRHSTPAVKQKLVRGRASLGGAASDLSLAFVGVPPQPIL
jgi:hypothetical protein